MTFMRSAVIGLVALAAVLTWSCGGGPDESSDGGASETHDAATAGDAAAAAANDDAGPVHVDFANVHLRVAPGVVVEVRRLQGELRSRHAGEPPVFDDPSSYDLHVDDGEIALTTASLSRLLNDHVFAYDDAPLSDIELSIDDGRLEQKAKLHKGISVPFSVEADVSVAPDGRVRLRPAKVDVIGLPVGGLMDLIGLEIDELVDVDGAPAVALDGDDFLLDASRLLEAPRLVGRLSAIRLEDDRIVQVFGKGAQPSDPPADGATDNYMYYRGGMLRFGKLTMRDTDMQLIDADPSDPFDFVPARYVVQLTAGYSKNTASGGLRVYMPDYAQAEDADLRPASRRPPRR
jgi:hypothetical protein